ncbi:MAG: PHP domain-containing protein [Caldilineaceae bacterium]|nr:PHP domain-containing protein [Caldilineaceae bacterium]
MTNSFDLHLHTTASDGTLTPQEVVEQAAAASIQTIAFTDHDTLSGYQEARSIAADLGVQLLAGVELNTDLDGAEVDILGYFTESPGPEFLELLEMRQTGRIHRAEEIVRKLNDLGLTIDFDRVRAVAHGAMCRPHIAQVMIEQGYVQSQSEAYTRYIGLGAPAHVEHDELDPRDAIHFINAAGGAAVIAHPGLIGDDAIVFRLIEAGVSGLEAYYPEHSAEDTQRYLKIARDHGLLVTGGTDGHGPGRKKSSAIGSITAPAEIPDNLNAYLHERIANGREA